MQYKDFMGQIQSRLELPELGRAVRATRAVLTTLGERLQAGEAQDLAGSLPMEVDYYLTSADSGQRFDYDEFVDRVAERANVNKSDAAYYGKVVVGLVSELISRGEVEDVRGQLTDDYQYLFALIDAEEVEEE
ncbi:DUF2267 domain-containing protein [Halorussus halophilus]|uniref:DUF2267 domain-containing protein n=1 Tax=Halorussus halophilus TaxID=2650975 RepID=UPI001301478F|nr:DUF2267 domain-containing protein [Halorussus halophilus]